MEYLHSQKVAHMDLKPQNVLICLPPGKQMILKLADFGLSQSMSDGSSQSSFRGSPLYMAPEVFSGKYDARVDIYSCGVILFEMLYMRTPFEAKTLDDLLPVLARCDGIKLPATPLLSTTCLDFLTKTLAIEVEDRLTFAEMFQHPFLDLKHLPSENSLARLVTGGRVHMRRNQTALS
jgi:serine/threonine protein kinase